MTVNIHFEDSDDDACAVLFFERKLSWKDRLNALLTGEVQLIFRFDTQQCLALAEAFRLQAAKHVSKQVLKN